MNKKNNIIKIIKKKFYNKIKNIEKIIKIKYMKSYNVIVEVK